MTLRPDATPRTPLGVDTAALKHTFEIYEGDHVNRVSERLERLVFFFAAHPSDNRAPPVSRPATILGAGLPRPVDARRSEERTLADTVRYSVFR